MTSVAIQPSSRTSITIERLRLEAALRHREVPLSVHAGKLLIRLEAGDLPVAITHVPPAGVRVEFRAHLGTCLTPDAEFLSYVASVNAKRTLPLLEVQSDGITGLFWGRDFERAIDVEIVLQGLIEISEAFTEIGTELREHFFVQPLAGVDTQDQEDEA